jgi:hypothetical protein
MFLTLNRRPTVIDHHTGDEPAMKERTLVIFRPGRRWRLLAPPSPKRG